MEWKYFNKIEMIPKNIVRGKRKEREKIVIKVISGKEKYKPS